MGRRDEEPVDRLQRIHPEPGSTGRAEGPVQDRVGDPPKGDPENGGRPWGLHRPEPVVEHSHCRAKLWKTHLDALLRLEARAQDWYVI